MATLGEVDWLEELHLALYEQEATASMIKYPIRPHERIYLGQERRKRQDPASIGCLCLRRGKDGNYLDDFDKATHTCPTDERKMKTTAEKLDTVFAPKKANNMIGIGGGPTRATTLPESPAERKTYPIASGVLDYFPDAIAAISHLSWKGNEQHNPGQPLHWARGKSTDEADTMLRHFLQRGTVDTDGIRHSVKMAWRALALLQKEIEGE